MNYLKAVLLLSAVGYTSCQEHNFTYTVRSSGIETDTCPDTQSLRKSIRKDVEIFINTTLGEGPTGRGLCGCGGPGWRRVAFLNMSDTTQTCPGNWSLITSPRRSCARPANASFRTCYSAVFSTQDIEYTRVCGRIIGYQVGESSAFVLENIGLLQTIDGAYVDGVSLTHGNPRQHIWTFAAAPDERDATRYFNNCPCTNISQQITIRIPPYVNDDYFCETGVPHGERFSGGRFYPDDPLWDGRGCGPTSACCTFNNPPWFCKQLPRPTSDDLEARICSNDFASHDNTAVELVDIYIK